MDKWLVGANRCRAIAFWNRKTERRAPPSPATVSHPLQHPQTARDRKLKRRRDLIHAAQLKTSRPQPVSEPRLTRDAQERIEQRRAIEQLRPPAR